MIDKTWLRGCDLSHWNTDEDYKVCRDNLDFCIIKATQGGSYVDPKFEERFNDLIMSGKCVAVYHFCENADDASVSKQLNNIYQHIPTASVPIILDVENYNKNGKARTHLAWNKLSEMCSKIHERYGRDPIIYASYSLIMNAPNYIRSYPYLWVARYKSSHLGENDVRHLHERDKKYFWELDVNAWQTDDRMYLRNKVRKVDSDYFNGSYADFMNWGC